VANCQSQKKTEIALDPPPFLKRNGFQVNYKSFLVLLSVVRNHWYWSGSLPKRVPIFQIFLRKERDRYFNKIPSKVLKSIFTDIKYHVTIILFYFWILSPRFFLRASLLKIATVFLEKIMFVIPLCIYCFIDLYVFGFFVVQIFLTNKTIFGRW